MYMYMYMYVLFFGRCACNGRVIDCFSVHGAFETLTDYL